MFFGKSDSTAQASSPANDFKQKLKDQTSQELAVADVTELVNTMTKNCYDLCFANPGPTVTSAQSKCTDQCAQKFMAAWNLVSQAYVSRVKNSA